MIGLPRASTPKPAQWAACGRGWNVPGRHPGSVVSSARHVGSRGLALQPERICQIVQAAVARIGLDPRLYGSHSLRAGFVHSGWRVRCGRAADRIADRTPRYGDAAAVLSPAGCVPLERVGDDWAVTWLGGGAFAAFGRGCRALAWPAALALARLCSGVKLAAWSLAIATACRFFLGSSACRRLKPALAKCQGNFTRRAERGSGGKGRRDRRGGFHACTPRQGEGLAAAAWRRPVTARGSERPLWRTGCAHVR